MTYLKKENMKKCFSLLRQFIDEASVQDNKKGAAVLALSHLQKITAGQDLMDPGASASMCVDTPRINAISNNL